MRPNSLCVAPGTGTGSDHQQYGAQVESDRPGRESLHECRRNTPQNVVGKIVQWAANHLLSFTEFILPCLLDRTRVLYRIAVCTA